VTWDEAREVVTLLLLVSAALVLVAPILARLIDGQLDRAGWGAMTDGVQPTSGLMLLAAGVLVATTPPADVVPALRRTLVRVAFVAVLLGLVGIIDLLFAESTGGTRRFFLRFPQIMRFKLPGTLLAGAALWLGRRVVPFPER
jgi:ABC-type Fe3+ transport system permease subunit